MIRRSTVVYITVLLVVAGIYFVLRTRQQQPADATATSEATAEVSYLFTADEGAPTGIVLKAKSGEAVEVARNAENAWALKQPVEAPAEQGSAEAVATQVTTMRILERIPKIDLAVVGLKQPEYVLIVNFNGTERTVHIGVVTPTESGYYVQDAAGGDVLVVTKSSMDAILRLLTSPPYAETPTPGPGTPQSGTGDLAETPTP